MKQLSFCFFLSPIPWGLSDDWFFLKNLLPLTKNRCQNESVRACPNLVRCERQWVTSMTNQSQDFEDGSARRESFADSVVSRERRAHKLIPIRNPSTQAVIMFSIWGLLAFTNHGEPSWSMIHFSLWVKNILNLTPSLWRKEIEHKSYNGFFWKEVNLLGTYTVFITNDRHHLCGSSFWCVPSTVLCNMSIFSFTACNNYRVTDEDSDTYEL